MLELPFATHLAVDAVRRQFDPAAPPEPHRPRRTSHLVRQARLTAAAVLQRAVRAVAPAPEWTSAH